MSKKRQIEYIPVFSKNVPKLFLQHDYTVFEAETDKELITRLTTEAVTRISGSSLTRKQRQFLAQQIYENCNFYYCIQIDRQAFQNKRFFIAMANAKYGSFALFRILNKKGECIVVEFTPDYAQFTRFDFVKKTTLLINQHK